MKKALHRLFWLGILSLLWLSSLIWLVNAADAFWDTSAAQIAWIANSGTAASDSLVTSLKIFINRVLGILSLITMVILLYAGFQMVTAAWDDTKYKNWFKILKQAAFGLAFIWLSWLIVSMIFRVLAKLA